MNLSLTLTSQRPAFVQGERLALIATVSNAGAEPVVLEHLDDWTRWSLSVGDWNVITLGSLPPAPPRPIRLAPGESRSIPVSLGREHAFRAREGTDASIFPRRHLLAGTYTVTVRVPPEDGAGRALEARLDELQIRARDWTRSPRTGSRPRNWDRARWLAERQAFDRRIASLQQPRLWERLPRVRHVVDEIAALAIQAGHLLAAGAATGARGSELTTLAVLGADLATGLFCMRVIDKGSMDCDLGAAHVDLPAAGADLCMSAMVWVDGFLLGAIGRRVDACTVLARIGRAHYESVPNGSPPHVVAWSEVLRAFWTEAPVASAVAELEAACADLAALAESTDRAKTEAKRAAEEAAADADHTALVMAVQERSMAARLASHRLDHALETRALARALAAALEDRPDDADRALVEALEIWRRRLHHPPSDNSGRATFLAGLGVASLIYDDGHDPMVDAAELPLELIRAPLTQRELTGRVDT